MNTKKSSSGRDPKPASGPLKAVILAGGPGTARCPVVDAYPSLLFPMLDGQPLVKHLLDQLSGRGIRQVVVSTSGQGGRNDRLVDALSRIAPPDIDLGWQIDNGNRGAGGALKELEWFLSDGPAVVLHPSVWLGCVDLRALWEQHAASNATVTMVLESTPRGRRDLENVALDENGIVERYSSIHVSRDNRRRLHPAGIYIIQPEILQEIEPGRFVDLNEQVLGWLSADGYRVQGHVLQRPLERFVDAPHYLDLNRGLMLQQWRDLPWPGGARVGVSIPDDAEIADDATLIGPAVVGRRCRVGPGAVVIGPIMLGDDVQIGAEALIRDSVIWQRSRVEPRAVVEYSLVTEDCAIRSGERVMHAIVDDGGATVEPIVRGLGGNGTGGLDLAAGDAPRAGRAAVRATYETVKRALDIALPILALPLLAPILLITALAVRLDSPGPAIFRQVRCGRYGREFTIFKFRTMVQNADDLYAQFLAQNEVSGPMFKMKKDPRTTRTGEFLRRTSLDELPQLWNVLRGEMSLVGPRPLAMREMVWCPRWRDQRLTVKPGMTGLWQVSSRGEFDFDGWIEHDIRYVKQRSLWFDIRILLRTVRVILHRPNVA